MVHTAAVDIEEMRGKMHTVDELKAQLAATEPLEQISFPQGTTARFHVATGWESASDLTAPSGCFMDIPGGQRLHLTKQTVLEAGALAGIPRKYQERLPNSLLVPQLDYWFSGQAGALNTVPAEVKALCRPPAAGEGDHPIALGLTRGTIVPFSNLRMLDALLAGITGFYGPGEVMVDYKNGHTLERTDFRLIVPGHNRTIQGTRVANDTWSTGISFRNSLVGLKPPRLDGYLFRYWCTNGSIDTLASAGQLARKAVTSEEEAYDWARNAVDAVLGGLEESLDAVQELAGAVVVSGNNPDGGSRLRTVLEDLFNSYDIPVRERRRIMAQIAELGGDITLYDIMQAITVTANVGDGSLSPRAVEQIMTLGGHTVHAASGRCHECYRLLPEGWVENALAAASPN